MKNKNVGSNEHLILQPWNHKNPNSTARSFKWKQPWIPLVFGSPLPPTYSWAIDWPWVWGISDKYEWTAKPKIKIKLCWCNDWSSKHEVKLQWIMKSKVVTHLEWNDVVNYLIRIRFKLWFWWDWGAQVRVSQPLMRIQLASGRFNEGIGMFLWCWKWIKDYTWLLCFGRKWSLFSVGFR